jgi:hypothetical protein
LAERCSDLVRRAAAGDHRAIEEIRSILARPGYWQRPFGGGEPDRRRRRMPSLEESTGKSADELTITVLAAYIRANLSSAADLPVRLAPTLITTSRTRRMPWVHRGRPHRRLR